MKKELAEKVNSIVKKTGTSLSAGDVLSELLDTVSEGYCGQYAGLGASSDNAQAPAVTAANNTGDPETHFSIGYFYERGIGTEKDQGRAVLHYRFAALSGFPFAIRNLQSMADRGINEALPALLDYYQRVHIPPDGEKVKDIFCKIAGTRGLKVSKDLLYVLEKIFSSFSEEDIKLLSEKLDSLTEDDIKTYNEVLSPDDIMLKMPVSLKKMRQESGLETGYVSGGWGFSKKDAIVIDLAAAQKQNPDSDDEILLDDILFDIMDCIAFYHGSQAGLPEPSGEKISQELLPPEKNGSGKNNFSGAFMRIVHEISGIPSIVLFSIDKAAARGNGLTREKISLFDKIGRRLTVHFNIAKYIRLV